MNLGPRPKLTTRSGAAAGRSSDSTACQAGAYCPPLPSPLASAVVGFVPSHRCGAAPDLHRIPCSRPQGATCDARTLAQHSPGRQDDRGCEPEHGTVGQMSQFAPLMLEKVFAVQTSGLIVDPEQLGELVLVQTWIP